MGSFAQNSGQEFLFHSVLCPKICCLFSFPSSFCPANSFPAIVTEHCLFFTNQSQRRVLGHWISKPWRIMGKKLPKKQCYLFFKTKKKNFIKRHSGQTTEELPDSLLLIGIDQKTSMASINYLFFCQIGSSQSIIPTCDCSQSHQSIRYNQHPNRQCSPETLSCHPRWRFTCHLCLQMRRNGVSIVVFNTQGDT